MAKYHCKYPPLSKEHLAEVLQVKPKTVQRLLNKKYFTDIEKLGYTKYSKVIDPEVTKWLCEKLCIELVEIELVKQKTPDQKRLFSERYES